jgi:hypothetical protein
VNFNVISSDPVIFCDSLRVSHLSFTTSHKTDGIRYKADKDTAHIFILSKSKPSNILTIPDAMGKTPRRGKGKHGTNGAEDRIKRHQTKLACGWCRKLSKKCDAQRPCERCIRSQRCDDCEDAPVRRPRQGGLRPAGLRCPSEKKPKESERVSKTRAEDDSADECSEGTECDAQEGVALDERIIPWLEHVAEMTGNGTANHFEGAELEYPTQDIGQVVSPFSGPLQDMCTLDLDPLNRTSFSPSITRGTYLEDHSPILYESNERPLFIWDDDYIHLTLEGFRNRLAYFRIRGLL